MFEKVVRFDILLKQTRQQHLRIRVRPENRTCGNYTKIDGNGWEKLRDGDTNLDCNVFLNCLLSRKYFRILDDQLY